MKRNKPLLWMLAAVLYVALLWLLTAVESAAPGGTIVSFPMAFWYSVTTLTTVGYGDAYPVTTAGRVIGLVFELMSLGLLVFLVGAVFSLMKGRLLPMLRLRFLRGRPWYIFSDATEAAASLARSLAAREPDSVLICTVGEDAGASEREFPGTCVALSPGELAAFKRGRGGTDVFCMGRNGAENERLARTLRESGAQVWCMTGYEPENLPERQTCFDPFVCCARLYWHRYPLRSPNEKIVFVGDGRYADALLEQALILNVLAPDQSVVYRLCGDYSDFRRNHPDLLTLWDVDTVTGKRDALVFAPGPWNADLGPLREADRILFCGEDEAETVAALIALKRYCPVRGEIHARLRDPFDGVTTFGSADEIFTPELVMGTRLNRTAMRLHEIYCAGVGGGAPWSELSSFARRSNLASTDHLPVKTRILLGPEAEGEDPISPERCARAYAAFSAARGEERERLLATEHERWSRFHVLNNWTYGPEKDAARRLHPCLRPYEDLPREIRELDAHPWALLHDLAEPPAG